LGRRKRELWLLAKGVLSTRHPVQVHIIPVRRCNLACGYCNEYDDFSKPVPLAEMLRRIDRLASFGTTLITLSGGEPLLHPDLDDIIRRIRRHGILAGLITNGYLLTRERIERLNAAGLDHLQISIDNVQPDDISKKSLKVLDQKLKLLAEYAEFPVVINSVLGSGVRNPEDALVVARRARELGLNSSIGIIHDGAGQRKPLSPREHEVFEELKRLRHRPFWGMDYFQVNHAMLNFYQNNIAQGKPNHWRCRAGSRYLYVCEDGLVHYCSQQRGWPGIPLEQYTNEQRRREFYTKKPCASYCTIACVQQTSMMDFWRAPQTLKPSFAPQPQVAREPLVQLTTVQEETFRRA
jgi:MoaA/NifB/PqqE/SkfB family radical SAM enzyme